MSQTLSDLMDEIENDLGDLRYGIGKDKSLAIFAKLDEVKKRLLETSSLTSLQAEWAQFIYIEAKIHNYASTLLHEIGGSKQLDLSRQQVNPLPENWWWFLDTWLNERRKASARRVLMIGSIVIGVLSALVLVYQFFLAPDPATQAKYAHEVGAQQAMINGEFNQALNEINQGLKLAPDDFEFLVLKGVTLQKLGHENEAQDVFMQAEKKINIPEQFLKARALVYLQVSNPQAALLDTQEILKINPESPEAYFYSAQAYQDLNNNTAAYEAYQKASDLAQNQNKTELAAAVRMNMGYLLQSMGAQIPTLEPTPGP